MWKKLCAAVVGWGLAASGAAAQIPDPDFPKTGVLATPGMPAAESPPQHRGFWKRLTGAIERMRARKAATPAEAGTLVPPRKPSPLDADGFQGDIFKTPPTPPRSAGTGIIPAGGQLTLPVTTPAYLPDVVPAEPADDGATPTPEELSAPTPIVSPPDPEERVRDLGCVRESGPWVWGSAEVLVGMTRGVAVPPIVTTGPVAAGPGVAGVLGQPGTVPLFGGRRMLNDWRAGLRAEAGVWFGDEQSWGAAARFYSLFSTSEQLVGGGNGTNVVNVPQFLTPGGAVVQVPVYVGFPGLTRGTVSTTAQTTFTGGDLSLRHALFTREHWRFEVVAGYRQLHLGDELGDQFTSSLTPLGLPATLIGEDSVRTRNNFYGGQLGTISTFSWDFWSLENTWAVALGNTASDVDFSRALLVSAGGLAPVPLVQSATGGRVNYFGVVAEAGAKLGLQLTAHARLTFSYTFLYWSNVRRAQEQFTMSPSLTGGTTYFFTHALGWGVDVRY